MTRFAPEFFSPDEVYAPENRTAQGEVYGPNGDDFTGTLVAGGSAPTTPGTLIGQWLALNPQGVPESGVDLTIQIVAGPGAAGYAYDSEPWTVTTGGNGVAEFDGVQPSSTYLAWRGRQKTQFTLQTPAADDVGVTNGRFDFAEVVGREES